MIFRELWFDLMYAPTKEELWEDLDRTFRARFFRRCKEKALTIWTLVGLTLLPVILLGVGLLTREI